MKKFFEEFKAFAIKGNAMDLAVGMMVGAAFTSIVNSLVNNIISPLIGLLVKVDFSDLVLKIGEVDVQYGAFIMAIINFLIVALVLFFVVKAMNMLKGIGKKPVAEAPAHDQGLPLLQKRNRHRRHPLPALHQRAGQIIYSDIKQKPPFGYPSGDLFFIPLFPSSIQAWAAFRPCIGARAPRAILRLPCGSRRNL